MENNAAIRIQRAWRSIRGKCSNCGLKCYIRDLYSTSKICEDCASDFSYGCPCGDWICDRKCGALWCGCIDICRGRCGIGDNVGYMNIY
jgi:hypothetical protein